MTPAVAHKWTFAARFRRHAFGGRSQPAVQRVGEAVAEIQKVAKKDPAPAAAGAVLFLEKASPALGKVDGSSGAIGTVVNHAIEACARIIAEAPVDADSAELAYAASSSKLTRRPSAVAMLTSASSEKRDTRPRCKSLTRG